MSTAQVTSLPLWFQVTLGIVAILGFVGGAAFALLVIWPSIRRSNRMSDWIEREGKSIVDDLRGRSFFAGVQTDRNQFVRNPGEPL